MSEKIQFRVDLNEYVSNRYAKKCFLIGYFMMQRFDIEKLANLLDVDKKYWDANDIDEQLEEFFDAIMSEWNKINGV